MRELASKYGVPFSSVQQRSYREGWGKERKNAEIKSIETVVKKNAEKNADNATLAADIKRKALLILDRLFDEYVNVHSTEHRDYEGRNVTDIKRLRDLTSAYKDLTDDIAKPEENNNPILSSLLDLMRGAK